MVFKRVATECAGIGPYWPASRLGKPEEQTWQVVHIRVAVTDEEDSQGIVDRGGARPGQNESEDEQAWNHCVIVRRESPLVKPRLGPAFD